MKAIEVTEFGGPEVMCLVDLPKPSAGPGEVIVKLAFVGINFKDVYMRTGVYKDRPTGPSGINYEPKFPFILGLEGAGTVEELGAGVEDLAPGDRVAFMEGIGAYAEFVAVPGWRVVRVPDDVSLELAAATQLQGSTAHYLCHGFTTLGPGSSCLAHAGAGGVGHILIQLAKRQGARVLTTVGSEEKADFVRKLGADVIIPYREVDFREVVMAETDGQGVDIVWDSIGIETIHDSIRCAKTQGICVLFGSVSGQVNSIAPLELGAAGSVLFTRSHVEHFTRNAEEVRMRADGIFSGISEGWLEIVIDRILPFDDFAEAQRALEARETKGKVLLSLNREGSVERTPGREDGATHAG